MFSNLLHRNRIGHWQTSQLLPAADPNRHSQAAACLNEAALPPGSEVAKIQ